MKIAIKEILKNHFDETGEYITQKMLAEEMVKSGVFKNIHSAQNMLQYNLQGKAKSLDIDTISFLRKRFNLTFDQIIQS